MEFRRLKRRFACISLTVTVFAFAGCKSQFIEATLENRSGQSLSLIQVEYPNAAFGTQTLAPAGSFHYRFKLLGNGPIKVTWLDQNHTEHHQQGPTLLEGEKGRLAIVFTTPSMIDFTASVSLR